MYETVCRLLLGFMLPTWFLSMWVSNTATTAMMLPIAEAVMLHLEEIAKQNNARGILARSYNSV